MTKIVYNACYGGFGLSDEAMLRYAELKGITIYKGKGNALSTPFYTVPEKEYKRVEKEALKTRDYTRLNEIYYYPTFDRQDPILVQVVEELGTERASGRFANLQIAEVPSGTAYRIDEYDGSESVMTNSDYDWRTA